MKRFIADALLVCLLVSIGSYILHKEDSLTQNNLEQQIDDFEADIALQKNIKANKSSVTLNDIDDNIAGKFAKKSSEFVIDTIKGTVITFTKVFEEMLN